ncbi:MAG: hypothetical protein HYS17_10935 [Micavibrio aeruginosavorus]|uniref:Uncharacterized protein n=1 Tax=Micavibrio aeruginosavorus TaxID=349221 RepID=A0A7T5R1V6_9BACT|nr:MAG: hypothetical protein HYS17_10935 [Micavibrio aeruginosavorus]
MADTEKLSFAFKAATTFTLDELRQRAGEHSTADLFQSTMAYYEQYLLAQASGHKFIAVHPVEKDVRELDDCESLGRHKLMGIVHLDADLTQAHTLKKRSGQITTAGLLTRAFILRENIVEAQEHGWQIAVWDTGKAQITVLREPQTGKNSPARPLYN